MRYLTGYPTLFFYLDYIADIYLTLTTTPKAQPKMLAEELKGDVPAPINTMLEKESKEEAITKYQARKEKVTVICPPSCTGTCSKQ